MKPWSIYGLTRRITEKFTPTIGSPKRLSIFKRSMHIFAIDVSNDNALNLEIAALASPQYNIHRFGIFFADSPRHADLLLILGRCSEKMVEPLKETVNQIPEPFGIIVIEDENSPGISAKELRLPNVIGYYNRHLSAAEMLSILLRAREVR